MFRAAAILSTALLGGAWSYPANAQGECVPQPVSGQGGEGIKAPTTAPAGGTIDVGVGPNDTEIQVSMGSADDVKTYDIPPSKTVTIPIPNEPGAVVSLAVGKGFSKRIVYVLIVAPGP